MISPAVEMIASLQAAEALKWLSGSRQQLRRTLVQASLWPFSMRERELPGPSLTCPHCASSPSGRRVLEEEITPRRPLAVLCGQGCVPAAAFCCEGAPLLAGAAAAVGLHCHTQPLSGEGGAARG